MDFIDHLIYTIYPGHNFLGDLFFMEAEQPPPQKKNAVLALARNPSHGIVAVLDDQSIGRTLRQRNEALRQISEALLQQPSTGTLSSGYNPLS